MNRPETLAHNAGVEAAIAFASALADDIRAIANDPERYPAAVAALEVVIEAAPRFMLPVPSADESDLAALRWKARNVSLGHRKNKIGNAE